MTLLCTLRWMVHKLQRSFLFASFEENTSTTRKVHLHRLVDLLYVCIHRRDWNRAGRAWSILTRCSEFDWRAVWQFGIIFASCLSEKDDMTQLNSKSLEYLRVSMLRIPQKKLEILQEIVIQLIHRGEYQKALEDLELYLPLHPYQEDIVLNMYAALLHLYLGYQISNDLSSPAERNERIMRTQNHIRECRGYLRRASDLGKDHPMPMQILSWLESNSPDSQMFYKNEDAASESDEDTKLEGK